MNILLGLSACELIIFCISVSNELQIFILKASME